jgi:serpin B
MPQSKILRVLLPAAALALASSNCTLSAAEVPAVESAGSGQELAADEPSQPMLGGFGDQTAWAEPATIEAETAALRQFHQELYAELSSASGDVVFSALSVSAALRLALEGARGDTRDELANLLNVPLGSACGGFGELMTEIRDGAVEGTQLRIANRIWSAASLEASLNPAYAESADTCFNADVGWADFRDQPDAERARINGWVAEQTMQMIPELLPLGSVNSLTRVVLTNAIYFKADWRNTFNVAATTDLPFHRANGDSSTVPTMHRTGDMSYSVFPGGQILRLPYADGVHQLVLILPAEAQADQLDAYIGDPAVWSADGRSQRVALALPRFTARYQTSLLRALAALGMQISVTQQADFSGIVPTGGLQISDVIHEAVIVVDEEGSEAAAATAVMMRGRSVSPPPTPVVFDRPFGFVLERIDGHVPLFAGRYTGE